MASTRLLWLAIFAGVAGIGCAGLNPRRDDPRIIKAAHRIELDGTLEGLQGFRLLPGGRESLVHLWPETGAARDLIAVLNVETARIDRILVENRFTVRPRLIEVFPDVYAADVLIDVDDGIEYVRVNYKTGARMEWPSGPPESDPPDYDAQLKKAGFGDEPTSLHKPLDEEEHYLVAAGGLEGGALYEFDRIPGARKTLAEFGHPVGFTVGGEHFVIVHMNRTGIATALETWRLNPPGRVARCELESGLDIADARLLPGGRFLVVLTSMVQVMGIFDLRKGRMVAVLDGPAFRTFDITDDGRTLVGFTGDWEAGSFGASHLSSFDLSAWVDYD